MILPVPRPPHNGRPGKIVTKKMPGPDDALAAGDEVVWGVTGMRFATIFVWTMHAQPAGECSQRRRIMAIVPGGPATNRRSLGFGAAAVTLGFGGFVFFFLAPLGVLLSAAGLICGIIGWLLARPDGQPGARWSLWGTLLSLLALGANVWLLNYGTIKYWLFGG
jgi:hypothetical protein